MITMQMTHLLTVLLYRLVFIFFCCLDCGTRGGLMVKVLYSGLSGLSSSPGRGHFVVLLDKTLYSHSASLHPDVEMDTGEFNQFWV